jgi:excisionase family DNA binding protein
MMQAAEKSISVNCPIYSPIVSALEELFNQLPLKDYPGLVGELERLKLMAVSRLMSQVGAVKPTQEHDLLTIGEVAKRLKMSKYRVYELTRQGIIQRILLGRQVRVKSSAVADYLARHAA